MCSSGILIFNIYFINKTFYFLICGGVLPALTVQCHFLAFGKLTRNSGSPVVDVACGHPALSL